MNSREVPVFDYEEIVDELRTEFQKRGWQLNAALKCANCQEELGLLSDWGIAYKLADHAASHSTE